MTFISRVPLLALLLLVSAAPTPTLGGEELESVSRLVERVNAYFNTFQTRQYGDAYEMLASEWRKGKDDRKEWIRNTKKMGKSINILGWKIGRIGLSGNIAKVRVEMTSKSGSDQSTEQEDHYWKWENRDWYYIPVKDHRWSDEDFKEVPIPSDANKKPTVNIQVEQPRK